MGNAARFPRAVHRIARSAKAGIGEADCPHRWSPRFVKPSINDVKKVEIAAIDPDLRAGPQPPSLMEYAGWILNKSARFKRIVDIRFFQPRSDLSCHHVMIA